MTISNIPTIDELAADGARIAELDLETIAILLDDAKARASAATGVSRALQLEVEERFKDKIAALYLHEGKDTGAIYLTEDGYDIQVSRPKKVDWSQDQLKAIRDRIAAANDNPDDYIDTVLSVPERKFTAWPASIQSQFADARTVTPGATSIKLERVA